MAHATVHARSKMEIIAELGVWIVLAIVLFGIQLLPQQIIESSTAYIIAGGILSFALFYYYVAWKILKPEQRRFVKDIADLIFIGLIILVAKDYGAYFFTLLFLPVAAAVFALNLVHSLLVATLAATIAAFEIILQAEGVIDESRLLLSGGQILIFAVITLFIRALAIQIREEKTAAEQARAKAATLAHNLAEERKLEAMEREFVNLASHQLLTPLSIVRGYASLLLEDAKKLTKEQKNHVSEIHTNAKRMVQLIDDLRMEAKIVQHRYPINVTEAPVNRLVHELSDEFSLRIKKAKLKLSINTPNSPLRARYDVDATRQILWNLLSNAIQYTPAHGEICLSLRSDQHHVIVSIQDTGIGIPLADQPHIFKRFFRATNAQAAFRDGSGLGLVIARGLAERQHGQLTFESEPGEGTTFTLTLPRAKRRQPSKHD